jgi:hypothetical protein
MTRTFHIMEKDEWMRFVPYFHPMYGSHYIDLPSGKILVAVAFSTEGSEDHFADTAEKLSLPHPVLEGNQKLSVEHVAELSHLGITTEHTVLDVARAAAKIHPLVRLRIW